MFYKLVSEFPAVTRVMLEASASNGAWRISSGWHRLRQVRATQPWSRQFPVTKLLATRARVCGARALLSRTDAVGNQQFVSGEGRCRWLLIDGSASRA